MSVLNPVEMIVAKRDGRPLSDVEIRRLIADYTAGLIPDYQMSALLMAAFLQGMNEDETLSLTRAMLDSGRTADLASVPGIKVDKHSTGGVGDKISIVLAPLVAAAEVPVPMISGRGLGHSGGTLDKLESIPGFRTDLTLEECRRQLLDVGARPS
jgi:pyrimidine-nucleoside phosphorylase